MIAIKNSPINSKENSPTPEKTKATTIKIIPEIPVIPKPGITKISNNNNTIPKKKAIMVANVATFMDKIIGSNIIDTLLNNH